MVKSMNVIRKVKLKDVCYFQEGYVNPVQTHPEYFDGNIKWLRASDINSTFIYDTAKKITQAGFNSAGKSALLFEPNTIVISKSGTIGKLGIIKDYMCGNRAVINIKPKNEVDMMFLYYSIKNKIEDIKLLARGSVQKNLYIFMLENVEIQLPSLDVQKKISSILEKYDKKLEINNELYLKMEKYLDLEFYKHFWQDIENAKLSGFDLFLLKDLIDVVDNRGKTPQLVELSKYPILDVKAISGEGRIINYDNCIKYVSEEVYNSFFRSGHPKKNDILISTVGSLAEMKLYQKNYGTIAQNVIAMRSKGNYANYLFTYLKFIKNDLLSYNIGSVQPSIKVTQFTKHIIYLPKNDKYKDFEFISNKITKYMFELTENSKKIEKLRDYFLKKLLNN